MKCIPLVCKFKKILDGKKNTRMMHYMASVFFSSSFFYFFFKAPAIFNVVYISSFFQINIF